MENIEIQAINAIRILSAEAVEKAKSGHPGLPMGAAAIGYTLYAKAMKHNPQNPNFFNRDRFILSAGHGSMLLYSLLHLFDYGLTKEDLMNFRQLKSKTPGHPENFVTPGVETSTGPLGQGFANAVGFALAEDMLAAKFNKPQLDLVDHCTFVLCGDGCMQEGITYEAASLAGTWGLGKLICLYDSNDITIEGDTSIAFSENVSKRFEAMGWQVLRVNNGQDADEIMAAITLAKGDKKRPTMIEVKTVIGYGSDKEGSADTHGSPLGKDSLQSAKKRFGWTAKPFEVPVDIKKHYESLVAERSKCENEWNKTVRAYKTKYPKDFEEFNQWIKSKAPDLSQNEEFFKWEQKPLSTRNASEISLNRLSEILPNFVGGSADLAPSNKTYLKGKGDYSKENKTGRNFHFGIREHSMAAISNGLTLHGGFYNYCATFLVFSDYMKNAIRMSAIMELPVIYIFTHDSIGVGEDGPTHQPVEQLAMLRSIPNVKVFRPADGIEMSAAYAVAIGGKSPVCIIASRQDLPYLEHTSNEALKGGYILEDSQKETPDCILMASGSEVELILNAKNQLLEEGIDARVVSMPCLEVFEQQGPRYKDSVLPLNVRARVAVEAASMQSWTRYTGLDGATITMDTFGASAPAEQLFQIYGFTVDNVVATAKKVVKAAQKFGK